VDYVLLNEFGCTKRQRPWSPEDDKQHREMAEAGEDAGVTGGRREAIGGGSELFRNFRVNLVSLGGAVGTWRISLYGSFGLDFR
jgi:hypothetical protein